MERSSIPPADQGPVPSADSRGSWRHGQEEVDHGATRGAHSENAAAYEEDGQTPPHGPLCDQAAAPPQVVQDTAAQVDDWVANAHRIAAASNVITPARNSRFVLRDVLGRGGFGEVWESVQTSLWRLIAVKRPRLDLVQAAAQSPGSIRQQEIQFYQEAMTMAALDHPNIVPVYDLGVDGNGLPIVAMKKVRGSSWQDLIMQEFNAGSVQGFLERHVRILIDCANAVAFAHSRGIIHRDIKPAQVIVGEFGETLLTDWGVAVVFDTDRAVEHNPLFLESGYAPDRQKALSPAGTWAFMAPEQTLRTAEQLGPWTDIYLLGGTLYYLLTGRPPHDGKTPEETAQFARQGYVAPPQKANGVRYIPVDLACMAMRCMAPSPNQRPDSIESVIRDLREWVSGASHRREALEILRTLREALDENPSPSYEKLAEWEDALARATALCPGEDEAYELSQVLSERHASTALGNEDLNLARVYAKRLAHAPRRHHVLERIDAVERGRRMIHFQRVAAVAVSLTLFLMVLALYILATQRASEAQAGQETARRESQRRAAQAELADSRRQIAEREQYIAALQVAQTAVSEKAHARAMRSLLTAAPNLRGWEWEWLADQCHREYLLFPGHPGTVHDLAWLAGGEMLATASSDGVLRIWSTKDGSLRYALELDPSGPIERLMGSPDGQWLIAADTRGRLMAIRGEDLIQGRETTPIPIRPPGVANRIIEISRDSRWLAAVAADGTAQIWRLDSLPHVHQTFSVDRSVQSGMFGPGNKTWLTSTATHGIEIREVATGEKLGMVGTTTGAAVLAAAMSPDGRRVAVGDQTGGVRFLDSVTGAEMANLPRGQSPVSRIRFSPDGKAILVSYRNRVAVIGDTETGRLLRTLDDHQGEVTALGFSPLGRRAVTGGRDGNLIVHSWVDGHSPLILPGHSSPVATAEFSPNGLFIATGGMDGSARIWLAYQHPAPNHLSTGEAAARWTFPSSDDSWAVLSCDDGTLRKVTVQHGIELTRRLISPGKSLIATGSMSSGRIAVSAADDLIQILDGATLESVQTLSLKGSGMSQPPSALTFGPGATLLAGFPDGSVLAWTIESGNLTGRVHLMSGQIRSMQRASGSQLCALVDSNGELLIVDGQNLATASEETSANLRAIRRAVHAGGLFDVQFNPTGTALATAGADGRVRIHQISTGEVTHVLSGHMDEVLALTWHPAGDRILSAGRDGTIRFWETRDGRELLAVPAHQDAIHHLAFGPGGKRLFAASQDRKVSLLSLPLDLDFAPRPPELTWENRLARRRMTMVRDARPEAREQFLPKGYARARIFLEKEDHPGRVEYLRGIRELVQTLIDTDRSGVNLALRLLEHGAWKFRTLPKLDRTNARPIAMDILLPAAKAGLDTGYPTTAALHLGVDAYAMAVSQWTMRRITAHDSAVILDTIADLLERLGQHTDAHAIRRRALVCAMISVPRDRYLMDEPLGLKGPEFIETLERKVQESGQELPPQPPAELEFGSNSSRTNWLPGWISYDQWRDADEAGRDFMTDQIDARLRGYLDQAAPIPNLPDLLHQTGGMAEPSPGLYATMQAEGRQLLKDVAAYADPREYP